MTLNVQDYIGKPRDSKAETTLAEELRDLDVEQAFAFIWEYLDHDQVVGLELANRVLRHRNQFERLMQRGFGEADASTIRFWLDCCVPRVGARRAMNLLREAALRDADAGRRVIYWTRLVLLREDASLKQELDDVAARLSIEKPT